MRNGARSWLLATLSRRTIARISVDLGCGVGIAVTTYEFTRTDGTSVLLTVVLGLVIAFVAFTFIYAIGGLFHQWLVETTLLSLWAFLSITCGIILGLVMGAGGPGVAWAGVTDGSIAVLPTVLLMVFGIWACLLVQRRVRASRYWWATDVFVAVLTDLALLVLFNRDLLAALPAAGLLFPVSAWFTIRTWRVMAGSGRLGVRAGADIALSLLLGANLVLFVVWTANLFDLPEAEIAVFRGTLERVGSIADLPWSLWVGLYVVLAGMSLAFAIWPQRLIAITRWSQRFHIMPSIDASRRVFSGVHISLLVTVLIGLTASASLEPIVRGPLKAKYRVALQRELEAPGEQAAYDEIRRQFTADTNTSPAVQPLAVIISEIHNISSPVTSDATSTERDLARRLGQLQATTLQLVATRSVLSAPQAVTDVAKFDQPIHNEADLNDRLDRLDTQQRRADTATKQVDQAAELAATAVANMIQIPYLGDNEIVQIVREYLSGLVEASPLKDVFASLAQRLTGDTTPRADTMVVPDPERLEQAAVAALTEEKARVQVVDPITPDQAPAQSAVGLVNEVRYLDEHTGPCDGCPQPRSPGEDLYHNRPGEPVEPAEPVIPHPIIGW